MRLPLVLSLLALTPALASAETKTLEIVISAGKYDRKNEPVCVPVTLPEKFVDDRQGQMISTVRNPYGSTR